MHAQVKVAVVVEHLANHRTEMVYKIVSPPFHPMPTEGVSYFEDAAAEGDSDVDARADAAATADAAPAEGKKRKKHSKKHSDEKRPLKRIKDENE